MYLPCRFCTRDPGRPGKVDALMSCSTRGFVNLGTASPQLLPPPSPSPLSPPARASYRARRGGQVGVAELDERLEVAWRLVVVDRLLVDEDDADDGAVRLKHGEQNVEVDRVVAVHHRDMQHTARAAVQVGVGGHHNGGWLDVAVRAAPVAKLGRLACRKALAALHERAVAVIADVAPTALGDTSSLRGRLLQGRSFVHVRLEQERCSQLRLTA